MVHLDHLDKSLQLLHSLDIFEYLACNNPLILLKMHLTLEEGLDEAKAEVWEEAPAEVDVCIEDKAKEEEIPKPAFVLV